MKKLLPALLALFIALPAHAETLTFEGKVSAQIVREVSVPFEITVEKLLVNIGENVKKKQRLLQYALNPKDARTFQYDLYTGGPRSDIELNYFDTQRDVVNAAATRSSSAELSNLGLGSPGEAARNAKNHALLQNRLNVLKRKKTGAELSHQLQVEELSNYFGQPLKAGQKLPKEFFLTAPIAGTVINISSQARSDGKLGANASALTIGLLNPIQVQFQVYETEITKLHVGQPVTVEIVNRKELGNLKGSISMLSWQPTDTAIAVPSYYHVWADVENPDTLLKPGYKVLVHIETE